MLGLFDSGNGGLNTVRYVKHCFPSVDLVYKIDRENSPYGTKSEKELIRIVKNNIDDLSDRGARKILIACCTASTVLDSLDAKYKRISVPIINPIAARAAKLTKTKRIGVIATDRTVKSHAFKYALPKHCVTELSMQRLVALIDGGLSDGNKDAEAEEYIKSRIYCFRNKGIDTLILGCTHFPSVRGLLTEICAEIGINNIVDSALEGAMALCAEIE